MEEKSLYDLDERQKRIRWQVGCQSNMILMVLVLINGFVSQRRPWAEPLVAAAVLVALGMARVGISVATVTLLSANSELTTQLEETSSLNAQLKVQRSVLSSNARISRIATQNYGMVLTDSFVTLDLSSADEATADGEAAQTADNAAASPDVK